jgi:hypothetical protein
MATPIRRLHTVAAYVRSKEAEWTAAYVERDRLEKERRDKHAAAVTAKARPFVDAIFAFMQEHPDVWQPRDGIVGWPWVKSVECALDLTKLEMPSLLEAWRTDVEVTYEIVQALSREEPSLTVVKWTDSTIWMSLHPDTPQLTITAVAIEKSCASE